MTSFSYNNNNIFFLHLQLLMISFLIYATTITFAFPRSISEYNIWDGAFSKPGRPSWLIPLWGSGGDPTAGTMTQYLKNNQFDVLGITEAKTWIVNATTDKPSVDIIASAMGYKYSLLVEFPGDEYHLAFMSKSEIVFLEGLKKNFSHSGAIAKIEDVIYILVQLNPFSSSNREIEAQIVKEKVEKYNALGMPVVVFGDFNSLSPQDGAAGLHKDYNCSCPNQACEWACKDGKIDYDPVNIILSANMTDLCWYDSKKFTCQGSYPTEVYSQPYPTIRIDYIMVNDAFKTKWESTYDVPANAEVIKNNWTEHTSDHYPIQLIGPSGGWEDDDEL